MREGATVRPRSGTVRRDFEDGLRRFRDEAQLLVGFDTHPSVVSCRDFFRANGTAYLVMAYEEGRSLAEVLASREAEGRPFAEADLLAVMLPLLEGLASVHEAGVLHRDIKPSNILIRRLDERPVLIDFGAAKQATARSTKSRAPYTEGYAALEQVADAGKLGPWTDMYGVGAVMWRMVAGGNPPWEPPHPVRVERRSHAVVAAEDDPMPSASELGKGRFQPHLLEAIDRCLRLRERERIQDPRELQETLRMTSDQSQETGFADTAQAYAAQHGRVPEASVRVAKPEGLLAEMSELEGAGPPRRAADESWWNSVGMEFAWIPAGSFVMGSPEDEEGRLEGERRHEVRISRGFWMGKCAVTQEEWEAVMGKNPSCFLGGGSRRPVESVSWDDTQEFIRKLNKRESRRGYAYRLPTEAEWEYAARAGTTGARYGELDAIAWHAENSGLETHPVGLKRANAWGLYDMLGNVWEWTADWYGEYSPRSVTDPRGPSTGSGRAYRGGSRASNERFVRAAYRNYHAPGSRNISIGFRLVRVA